MQDNHPNRVFSFVLSFLLFKPLLFFLLFFFIPFPFLRVSSLFFVLSAVSLPRFPIFPTFSYLFTWPLSARSRRETLFFARQRDLLIALLFLARAIHPFLPYSAVTPRYYSFSDFLTPPASSFLRISATLHRHTVSPSPPTWRVIPRKPWYFVGHGVQSHGGPDEAWPHLLTTTPFTLASLPVLS